MSIKTLTLHIQGMHCKACTLLTEMEAQELPYITRAKSDLRHHTIEVEGEFEHMSGYAVATALTSVMHPHGYTVSVEKRAQTKHL